MTVALLFLLAVAASQVDLYLTVILQSGETDITSCPISFYGKEFKRVELEVQLDNDMVGVVTDSCWATNQPSPDGGLLYYLVIGGCPNPADQTVEMKGSGLGGSNSFSFRMFEFVKRNNGGSSQIYLHCKLELCPKGSGCAPVCSGGGARKRRSTKSGYAKGGQVLITMVWNN